MGMAGLILGNGLLDIHCYRCDLMILYHVLCSVSR